LDNARISYQETPAETYDLPNKPGALAEILDKLAAKGVNLNSIHAHRRKGRQEGRHCLCGGSRRKSGNRHRVATSLFVRYGSPARQARSSLLASAGSSVVALETRMKIRREGRMSSFSKKISRLALSLFFGSLFGVPSSRALDNGLALTPPMGWNSWNRFG